MPSFVILVLLVALGAIGVGILLTAVGIYRRLGELIATIADLRGIVAVSQAEIGQAADGIGRVHDDLARLVRDANKGAEIVRAVTRLPTR
ncbi:hypothetical protein [Enterovirga sp.]|uniref:hypothetical protein n=1 Tax=Enterovirga sp. TaxID=2026350 RepID=UPI002BF33141|nr:hypothetical protein [Enterovirga sp.]HMO30322.1 hypothetical protein [Enterovirga sp.]